MISLTPIQQQTLDFVRSFQSENGYSPSLREMAEGFDKSITSMTQRIHQLKKKRYIKLHKNIARGIEIL